MSVVVPDCCGSELSCSGSKPLSPFGLLASWIRPNSFRKKLKEFYRDIDKRDSEQWTRATCHFIHDFLLDIQPLEIEPSYSQPKICPPSTANESSIAAVNGRELVINVVLEVRKSYHVTSRINNDIPLLALQGQCRVKRWGRRSRGKSKGG